MIKDNKTKLFAYYLQNEKEKNEKKSGKVFVFIFTFLHQVITKKVFPNFYNVFMLPKA